MLSAQVEFHPHYRQPDDMYTICHRHRVLLQAYSSLGGTRNKKLFSEQALSEIAAEYKVSPAQVLLRWALQIGYGTQQSNLSENKTVQHLVENCMPNISSYLSRVSNVMCFVLPVVLLFAYYPPLLLFCKKFRKSRKIWYF